MLTYCWKQQTSADGDTSFLRSTCQTPKSLFWARYIVHGMESVKR